MANFYEQQAYNRRKTVIIIMIFLLFFAFIGLGFDVFVFRMSIPGVFEQPLTLADIQRGGAYSFPYAMAAMLAVALAITLNSVFNSGEMVFKSIGACVLNPDDLQHKKVLNAAEEASIAAGIKMPPVFIIPDTDPNALAAGVGENKSFIAITQGLADNFTREEIQAVIAHEIAHIKNRDTMLMTVMSGLLGALLIVSDMMLRTRMTGGGRSRSSSRSSGGAGGAAGGAVFIIWILAVILAPLIARVLAMSISRSREYLADATSAEITRNPQALASALDKIRAYNSPTRSIKTAVAHMCIDDPLGRGLDREGNFFSDMFSTHPPIENRIAALKKMSYQ